MVYAKKHSTAFIAVLTLLLTLGIPNEGYTQGKCLIVSDIHLDLNIKAGLKHLRDSDANLDLVKRAIAEMKIKLPHPAFIIIAGDFVGHKVQGNDKANTTATIAKLFRAQFGDVPIIPALGNNDSDRGDYVKPTADFLGSFAKAWNLCALGVNINSFKSRSGYYTAVTKKYPGLKFVVLNSSLVSDQGHRYKGNDKDTVYKEGGSMLNWLGNQLHKTSSSKKVWLIYHMPPGTDAYQLLADSFSKKVHDTLLWNPVYAQTFINTVSHHATTVKFSIAGHVHRNDFKVFCNPAGVAVDYLRVVSSISPNYGNNPSFEVAEFDKNFNVTKETTYHLDLDSIANGWVNKYTFKYRLPAKAKAVNTGTLYNFIIDLKKRPSANYSLTDYVSFYNVGTASTINDKANLDTINYGRYLRADVLKADQ
jgi:sphingomyelin phosphodiesterase acid-like 3